VTIPQTLRLRADHVIERPGHEGRRPCTRVWVVTTPSPRWRTTCCRRPEL